MNDMPTKNTITSAQTIGRLMATVSVCVCVQVVCENEIVEQTLQVVHETVLQYYNDVHVMCLYDMYMYRLGAHTLPR